MNGAEGATRNDALDEELGRINFPVVANGDLPIPIIKERTQNQSVLNKEDDDIDEWLAIDTSSKATYIASSRATFASTSSKIGNNAMIANENTDTVKCG
nr:1-aminocyclopropane-1-carboxylate synthase 11-like [Ipomoea batatas]